MIVNTSLCLETAGLNNGVLFHLLQDNGDTPLMLTEKNRSAVIGFLKRRYMKHRTVNKLINWFSHMKSGEYLYIYPYVDSSECAEFYDILKESLKYYNKHRGEAYVYKRMQAYFTKTEQIREFLQSLHYEIISYVPALEEKKRCFGEQKVEKRECIFCGKSVADDAKFKEEAHAISEAIGNKKFIQYEECDDCNSLFAKEVEEDLCNYLWLTRLRYGIKNKYTHPTFQLRNQYARYIDTEQTDENWGRLEVAKGKIKGPYKGPALIGNDNMRELEYLDIQYIKDYIPLHVYKALVKYAIGLMDDRSMRSHFKKTIDWLKEKDVFHPLPKVTIFETPKIIFEPELYLFKRKENIPFLPYCYGELRIGDKIFVFILPFCDMDDRSYTEEHDFTYFEKECLAIYTIKRTYEDFSGIDKKPLEIRLDLTNAIRIDEFCSDGD